MSKKKKMTSKVWYYISIATIVLPVFGGLVLAIYNGSNQTEIGGKIAGYLTGLSFISGLTALISIFNIDKQKRIIPVVGIILSLVVALLARETYWLSGMTY